MTPRVQLITWLNSAYAMEQTLIRVLQNHANDAKDHFEIAERYNMHVEESRHHAERVKQCLEILGEKPSTLKTAWGNVMGMVQGPSTGVFRDEGVKNALGDYASEHFEIACYQSLIAAADEANESDVAHICGEILEEEEAMAQWLRDHIPQITRLTLQDLANA